MANWTRQDTIRGQILDWMLSLGLLAEWIF